MPDYAGAAAELKARLDARLKKKSDLNDFFEAVKTSLVAEAGQANAELVKLSAPTVDFQQASLGEPTIELRCGSAICQISQDRSTPSIAARLNGETGETTITFLILTEESPLQAQRVSLTPQTEPRIGAGEIAAILVEGLIANAP